MRATPEFFISIVPYVLGRVGFSQRILAVEFENKLIVSIDGHRHPVQRGSLLERERDNFGRLQQLRRQSLVKVLQKYMRCGNSVTHAGVH